MHIIMVFYSKNEYKLLKKRGTKFTLNIVYKVAVNGWLLEYSATLKISKPHLFTSLKSLASCGSWAVSVPNFGNLVKLLVWVKVLFRTPEIWDMERPALALWLLEDEDALLEETALNGWACWDKLSSVRT